MNPEDNNPLPNPFATGGAGSNMSNTSMPNDLAAAQDNLTAAGMAMSQDNNNVASVEQPAMSDPNSSALPPVNEPLVPAAPVPGSIGSAISVPPAEPIAAPSFGTPSDPAPTSGPVPAPEVTPSPAPFNPFATPSANPAPAQPAGGPAHTAPAPQPTPASAPKAAAKLKSVAKAKTGINPLTLVLAVLSVALLVTTIIFFILWNDEKGNVKTVYVQQPSENGSNSAITVLSCSRSENHENPAGAGTSTVSLSYTGDNLSAYTSSLSLNFANEADANAVRDANAAAVDALASLVSGSLLVSANASGANYTYSISSQDGTEIAASDAMNAIYGTTEGDPSLSLVDVQAKYESEGYVCMTE